jgi:hypothetical protein
MFPLAGKTFPTSKEELAKQIRDAMDAVLTLPKKADPVVAEGGSFPSVKKLKINLNGASVSAKEPPPKPKPSGKREPGIEVEQLEVTGHPIQYENRKLELDLKGKGLRFDFGRDKKGQPLLILAEAEEGHVKAKISKADIEALAKEAANFFAQKQGVKVEDVDLTLTSDGPRSVAAEARVKAKKLVMSGVIRIKGKLVVDDELNATVSDLDVDGEGVIGSMVAPMLKKKIQPFNGTKIPLVAFSLGDVALRDLKITVKDSVQVTADFGKA